MNFPDERYVRLYTRDTITWKLIGWEGRCVLPLLLRKLDRAGTLDLEGAGADGLAALIDLPADITARGLAALESRGVVQLSTQALVMPKYLEAQECSQSDRLRSAEYRAKRRANLVVDPKTPVDNVTNRDAPVTLRDETSHGVTARHSVPSHAVPNRAEPSQEEIHTFAKTPPPARVADSVPDLRPGDGVQGSLLPDLPEPKQPASANQAAVRQSIATVLVQELSAARMRVNPSAKPLPIRPSTLKEIERCLREKFTVAELRNVIAVWEELVRNGSRDFRDFDAVTPFRAKNVEKYTVMSLEDARKPRAPGLAAGSAKPAQPQWRHDPTVGRRKSVEEIQRERDEWAAKSQR